MKYGIRYQNSGGDCVYTSHLMDASDVDKWWVFSPCNEGLAIGDTREAALAHAQAAVGATWNDAEVDPAACDVQDDSILTGVVEVIDQ